MKKYCKLNHISDEAAEDMRSFYQAWLDKKVAAEPLYEAYFYLGLIAWRNHDFDTATGYFSKAAEVAVSIYQQRSAEQKLVNAELFNFIHPLFLVICYGDEKLCQRLADLPDIVCMGEKQDEFSSVYLMFSELKKRLSDFQLEKQNWQKILLENDQATTHPYYLNWVNAFASGIIAIVDKKQPKLNQSIEQLTEFHREQAFEGELTQRFEGLVAFWALSLLKIAKRNGMAVNFKSEYLPEI